MILQVTFGRKKRFGTLARSLASHHQYRIDTLLGAFFNTLYDCRCFDYCLLSIGITLTILAPPPSALVSRLTCHFLSVSD